jgi:hypothetical protein
VKWVSRVFATRFATVGALLALVVGVVGMIAAMRL